ncbi:MAG: hypothetical protein KDI19_06245 [Pseudomonadales bacterium]|nr:hypothetical protein [Pseudomonadales bacterium]
MEISLDISLYPLADEYLPSIKSFIKRLEEAPGLAIARNDLSTQVFGDYDVVMDTLKREVRRSFETHGKAVFVIKFLMDDLRGLKDEPLD